MSPALTAAVMGLLIAASILYLVRRDHLHGSHAVWWLLVAVTALFIGLFPKWVDVVGVALGVRYPPMLLVMLAVAAILIKLIHVDIDASRRERRMRRLIQKMAILEHELDQALARREGSEPLPATRSAESALAPDGAKSGGAAVAPLPLRRSSR